MLSIAPLILTDSNFVSSNIPETDYNQWLAGTTYALGDYVRVVSTNVHKIYQSLAAGNIGNNPLTSPTLWNDAGSTNRWSMFDSVVNSQSQYATLIQTSIYVPQIIDSISFHNVDAQSVRLVQTDPIEGVIYDKEVNLVSDDGVLDYYEYFFLPVRRIKFYTFTGLNLYAGSTYTIYLKDDLGTAKCGACFFGMSTFYGDTQYGLEIGRTDFSNVSTDQFGNTSIVKRINARNLSMAVWVDNTQLAFVDKNLSDRLSVPSVYIGADQGGISNQEASTLYGIYQDYSIVVSYATYSILNIRFKGMI